MQSLITSTHPFLATQSLTIQTKQNRQILEMITKESEIIKETMINTLSAHRCMPGLFLSLVSELNSNEFVCISHFPFDRLTPHSNSHTHSLSFRRSFSCIPASQTLPGLHHSSKLSLRHILHARNSFRSSEISMQVPLSLSHQRCFRSSHLTFFVCFKQQQSSSTLAMLLQIYAIVFPSTMIASEYVLFLQKITECADLQ